MKNKEKKQTVSKQDEKNIDFGLIINIPKWILDQLNDDFESEIKITVSVIGNYISSVEKSITSKSILPF